jgi:hypothetical protein
MQHISASKLQFHMTKKHYHASGTTLATGATLQYISEIIYSRCYDPETYHASTCFTPEAGGGSDIFH